MSEYWKKYNKKLDKFAASMSAYNSKNEFNFIENNKDSSKDLFWILNILGKFLFLNAFDKAGKETVPTAMPAIARFIW